MQQVNFHEMQQLGLLLLFFCTYNSAVSVQQKKGGGGLAAARHGFSFVSMHHAKHSTCVDMDRK